MERKPPLLETNADDVKFEREGFTRVGLCPDNLDPNTIRMTKLDIISDILEAGAEVNASSQFGYTPLHIACQRPDAVIISRLLQAGAGVNDFTVAGGTALHTACQTDNLEVVKILLDAGANVRAAKIDGVTPLHFAA